MDKVADLARSWRTTVYKNYLIDPETGEEIDPPKPPEDCPFITLQTWENYKKQRFSEEFKVLYIYVYIS